MARNHELSYRPLIGGCVVINPLNDRPGTLGFVATDGTDRWIVSCYHVLCRSAGLPFADGEEIYQPLVTRGGGVVARTSRVRADPALDCAAARVELGVAAGPGIVGLPPLVQPAAEPIVGMRLLKSGAETGVTEGEIHSVNGTRVEIRAPAGWPQSYVVSEYGDSGALWVERETGAPVALHTSGSTTGVSRAFALKITAVLTRLGLAMLPPM